MSGAALDAHLITGTTTLCRCWAVTRKDGAFLGFTDHDRSLAFDGMVFRADSGMTARALQQTTGLSVDNTEALGALSDVSIREEDIEAGRYDGAEVRAWLVNWADPEARALQFRGTIGELSRIEGAFRAELRGLAEPLNHSRGRTYQAQCPAVLGDAQCGVDTTQQGFHLDTAVLAVDGPDRFRVAGTGGFVAGWFARGHLQVRSGSADGIVGIIKADRYENGIREVVLWEDMRAPLAPGDDVRLIAGCDKRAETCRSKFSNFLNFRGFPHIPGEDWLMGYPRAQGRNDGGSLN